MLKSVLKHTHINFQVGKDKELLSQQHWHVNLKY
ncbi:Uncharacterised protein [Mycobacterium tuberculosis]|nr:Uncharacterised protein [Mycobacterium tuberculosis]